MPFCISARPTVTHRLFDHIVFAIPERTDELGRRDFPGSIPAGNYVYFHLGVMGS